MRHHWSKFVVRGLGHSARHARAHGNHNLANGLTFLAFGICCLPIPIIGIPLIGFGIWQICKQISK